MALDAAPQIQVPDQGAAPADLGHDSPTASTQPFRSTSDVPAPSILDIRQTRAEISLVDDIKTGLRPRLGEQKTLPTLLLYDEKGLQLFEDITYLDEYYLTNAEIKVLEQHADKLASMVEPGSVLVELGSGNLRKVNIMLQALERHHKSVEYYALDCSYEELQRTLDEAPTESFQYVQCHGLFGTYDDGLVWLQSPEMQARAKVVLSMGSSIGNFRRPEAAAWLKQFADAMGEKDRILLGIDGCKDAERVYRAYNDRHNVTHTFTLNGLTHANRLLEAEEFDTTVWEAVGEYDPQKGCHRASVVPRQDTRVLGTVVKAGEKVRFEESYKYDARDLQQLWYVAGVDHLSTFSVEGSQYAMHLIAKKQYALPWSPADYAAGPVPTLHEWDALWKLWDTVSRQMIPDEELLAKPIKLRNACIFYLGHIPTFFDIKLAATTDGKFTEPTYFPNIFERGIDPDVDNPEQCHAHSEVPDNWPALDEILEYQRRVRDRVKALYADGSAVENRLVSRCLWLGYEHEAMHLETLLYMLVQSEKTLPPPATAHPNFSVLEQQAQQAAVPNKWFTVPEQELTINLEDPENESGPERFFGWDIEKPSRTAKVPSFQAQARPITNGEYAIYMQQAGVSDMPASWVSVKIASASTGASNMYSIPQSFLDGKAVRTVFGPVPLADALTWPVSASYEELKGCATYMGGRIPSFEEARAIYAFAHAHRNDGGAQQANANLIPAVNHQLVNDGVEESPPHRTGLTNGHAAINPHDLFFDLKGNNVGFQEWTPISVVDKGEELQGQAAMGGLWEWTSSPLRKHDGFEPMRLYEAFSQDFFDEKHNIVLGGSWATVPRIAGRKSFVNWYQRNYPYVWAGARLVRDL